jgi:uncharacterized protein
MRKNVVFQSKGLNCSGWLYVPDNLEPGTRRPAIVMAHGLTAVKEQALPDFAERFAAAGFAVMVFDYRFFGESEGEPRSQVFPLEMVEDYRNAITWLSQRPEVVSDRIGIWGTSYSGGLVLHVATFDKRVKALVAQVPATLSPELHRAADPAAWERASKFLLEDRIQRYRTGVVNYMRVVAPEGEPCLLPGKEAFDGYMALQEAGPNWRNQLTVESVERMREFDPVHLVHLISPAALLLIPAENDSLIPISAVRGTYEKAGEPKTLSVLPIGHFEIYGEPWLSRAADLAAEWFRRYL